MKIAILTQPLGKNYGGIMQAFALQKVLKSKGHDVVTINYRQAEPNWIKYVIRALYRAMKLMLGHRGVPVNIESYYPKILKNNLEFISKHINYSAEVNTSRDLLYYIESNSFEALVVGSDQTWRPAYSCNILDFYLDFIKCNTNIVKVAYASSFGVDNWEYNESDTTYIRKELISKFDGLSVREESGRQLCEENLGVQVDSVVDPTLLISKDVYVEEFNLKFAPSDKIYTYVLDNSDVARRFIESISKLLGLESYSCQPKASLNSNVVAVGIDEYTFPSPEQWLSGFYNAKYVLTDSFHGMVFSIIFEKPFFVLANKERGAARFESLLSSLGLGNRLLYNIDDLRKAEVYEDVDFKKAKVKLNLLNEKSLNFLNKYI